MASDGYSPCKEHKDIVLRQRKSTGPNIFDKIVTVKVEDIICEKCKKKSVRFLK